MSKKNYKKGGVVPKKMMGGGMTKKNMAKGGAVPKKMMGGGMTKKNMAKGGAPKKMFLGGKVIKGPYSCWQEEAYMPIFMPKENAEKKCVKKATRELQLKPTLEQRRKLKK